ncbi:MAG: poly-gamma-glutamate system protein [Bacteroidota bacterium]
MKNISIRSTLVLSILGVLAIALLIIVETTKKFQEQPHFQEKLQASTLTKKCMDHLKSSYFPNEVALDNINDPNETGLIGPQFSAITSGRGSLPVKLSTTNPNFAAMIVSQIKEAGLEEGDTVALCLTGSFPALDIATCAAIETLGLHPVLIASVTSSSWGANHPDLTWLDMHGSLHEAGLLSFMPVAASIGGNQDIGRTLSLEGREAAELAISRNEVCFINEGSLEANIARRMELFDSHSRDDIRLFINVGGGIASLGSNTNANTLASGLRTDVKLKDIPDPKGVYFEMAQRGVPTINLLNISALMRTYDLPRDPVPLPEIGEGMLYHAYKYDLWVVGLVTSVFIGLIVMVMYYDRKQNALGTQIVKNEEL